MVTTITLCFGHFSSSPAQNSFVPRCGSPTVGFCTRWTISSSRCGEGRAEKFGSVTPNTSYPGNLRDLPSPTQICWPGDNIRTGIVFRACSVVGAQVTAHVTPLMGFHHHIHQLSPSSIHPSFHPSHPCSVFPPELSSPLADEAQLPATESGWRIPTQCQLLFPGHLL